MNSEKYSILLVIPDQTIASDISEAIKQHFSQLPTHIEFARDGVIALGLIQKGTYHLVISMFDMPIMDGATLVHEIRRHQSSTSIILIKDKNTQIEEANVDSFDLPVTDMDIFCKKVFDLIPEDLKIKFGLKRRTTPLLKRLIDYSENHKKQIESNVFSGPYFAMLPNLFGGEQELDSPKISAEEKHEFKENEPIFVNRPYQVFVEMFWLALLLGCSIFVYSKRNPEAGVFNLNNGIIVTTMIIFVGYFISHGYERIINKKRR